MEHAVVLFAEDPQLESVIRACVPEGVALRLCTKAVLPRDVLIEAVVVWAPSCANTFVDFVFAEIEQAHLNRRTVLISADTMENHAALVRIRAHAVVWSGEERQVLPGIFQGFLKASLRRRLYDLWRTRITPDFPALMAVLHVAFLDPLPGPTVAALVKASGYTIQEIHAEWKRCGLPGTVRLLAHSSLLAAWVEQKEQGHTQDAVALELRIDRTTLWRASRTLAESTPNTLTPDRLIEAVSGLLSGG